jgi:hypothetical protein
MPFADELIGEQTAEALIEAIAAAAPGNSLTALRAAAGDLAGRSLRECSDLLSNALLRDLPGDYQTFARTIRAARDGSAPFSGWLIWPVATAIAASAIADGGVAAFDDAMAMLAGSPPG